VSRIREEDSMRTRSVLLATMLVAAAATLATAPGTAGAADFPVKPVTLVVAFAAGGPTDTIVRALQEKLGQRLGQPAVVLNKPGSGGLLAAEFVAKSKADGYTVLVLSLSHLVRQAIDPKMPVDMLKDFEPICTYVSLPIVFVVGGDSRFKTIDELIDFGVKSPGKLSFGSSGIGATSHLSGELFRLHAKLQFKHVPFAGEAPLLTAVMGGHVDFGSFGAPTVVGKAASGDVRVLATLEGKRIPYFKETPSFTEKGYPQIVMPSWYGFAVPAGTPKDVVARLNEGLRGAIKDPSSQAVIEKLGFSEIYRSPEETRAFVRAELERFIHITREANITVQ
jgi:tripartite-type tricarboxylate transporter receptor subunit TctC